MKCLNYVKEKIGYKSRPDFSFSLSVCFEVMHSKSSAFVDISRTCEEVLFSTTASSVELSFLMASISSLTAFPSGSITPLTSSLA
jgi:hypothetical protein